MDNVYSGPDCLKDVLPALGTRLKVYHSIKLAIEEEVSFVCLEWLVYMMLQLVIGSEKIRLIAQIMKIEIFVPSCRASQVQQNDV